ncbi:hypothetical protein EFT87_02790 [Schleiferilactobacillus harbinensis]|uniref:hypothetical protein n=1 Tax=Schleiferilactobacillus harbinensis TaxID=304207 RepID=UPI0021A3211E|nr:hypothetical protein [Schleiferilactobacillus harbinensis]MCT2907591.1 hypothetical protein [Schleiferilactobacillus harbinensis]
MAERKEPKDLKDYTEEELDHLLTKEDMIELAHEMGYLFPTDPGYPKELLTAEDKAKIAKNSEKQS